MQCRHRFSYTSTPPQQCYLDVDEDENPDYEVGHFVIDTCYLCSIKCRLCTTKLLYIIMNNNLYVTSYLTSSCHYETSIHILPFRTPVLAAVCQTLTLLSNGLKHNITNMLKCHVLRSTLAFGKPKHEGGADQMARGIQQM